MDEVHAAIQREFCPTFREYGKNLDAFADVCQGGFGLFDSGDDVTVIYSPPNSKLWMDDPQKLDEIKSILQENEHIKIQDTTEGG